VHLINRRKKIVSHLAKLTVRQVRWARKARANGMTHKCIMDKLGVSSTAVSFMLAGKTYIHVK
jgi:hypothetical protein